MTLLAWTIIGEQPMGGKESIVKINFGISP
jgi:hypothetical protein